MVPPSAQSQAPPAARGKKMTRSASRGISSNALTICACRRPAGVPAGHRGPHPLVELAAELLDEALLVPGHLDVALGEEDLAVARLHAQEPHRRAIMAKAARRSADLCAESQAHRPARRPRRAAQAVADRLRGDALAPSRAASSSVVAERELRGERRRVRAARAVGGAVRVALAGISSERRAVEEDVVASSRCPPVTTTARGPSAWTARARPSSVEPRRRRRARGPRGRSA